MTDTAVKTETAKGALVASTASADVATQTIPNLWDREAIKTDQDQIRVSLASLDARIHMNAYQCLKHAEKHGDTSLARRLIVDTIDKDSGYRRQALIGWFRMFSPMELVGDVIKLTGVEADGVTPRKFRCDQAYLTPFTKVKALDEQIALRPLFRDNVVNKVRLAIREWNATMANTKIENGKVVGPIDPKKPFFDGIHMDKLQVGFETISKSFDEMTSYEDSTQDARTAAATLKKAEAAMARQAA